MVATEHGVRVVMGDARGHGVAALGTAAALLGSFREAAHDEPDLGGLLRRLDRALARHLRDRARAEHPSGGGEFGHPVAEEFVTVLLLEIDAGEVRALNCGHPWPYRVTGHRVEPLARADPLPPLGPFPLPADLPAVGCGRMPPGETLVLYTDGVEDARDPRGRFFPLAATLAAVAHDGPATARTVRDTVLAGLLRHIGGSPQDDVALLVLHHTARAGCSTPTGGAQDRAPGHGRPASGRPPVVPSSQP
ncbi:PP2C family protein-serine/threonine phosphatase [Streptomyces echinoruber]|uniref:PP2C family protein-serine/threonine phosphatase n=1 Tax=Streptomyces echinoruber TaxID=68898 RepID=UPI0036115C3C